MNESRTTLLHQITPATVYSDAMLTRPVHYPAAYGVFVALAVADILLSGIIIIGLGGTEINIIAAWVFENAGLSGATFLKFATVVVVLLSCEFLGNTGSDSTARLLAQIAVIISAIPVTFAILQLVEAFAWNPDLIAFANGNPPFDLLDIARGR